MENKTNGSTEERGKSKRLNGSTRMSMGVPKIKICISYIADQGKNLKQTRVGRLGLRNTKILRRMLVGNIVGRTRRSNYNEMDEYETNKK